MQGYILHTVRVREEDLIVTLLTDTRLKRLYRFYGARHATINIGYKIDFEVLHSVGSTIAQLRHVVHLGNSWMQQRQRFYIWQQMIALLYRHLRDIEEVDPFYFELLCDLERRFEKQSPKRAAIEGYLRLLSHEGRLDDGLLCFLCDRPIQEDPILTRSFLPAHPGCLFGTPFARSSIVELFRTRSTLYLTDHEVDLLWEILLQGF